MNRPNSDAALVDALRASLAESYPVEPADAGQLELVMAQLRAPAPAMTAIAAARHRWTTGMLAAAVAVVVALIGVSTSFLLAKSSDPAPADTSTGPMQATTAPSVPTDPPSISSSQSPAPTTADLPPVSGSATGALVAADPQLFRVDDSRYEVAGMVQFVSPSGNIKCVMADQGVPGADCQIADADYAENNCPNATDLAYNIQFQVHNAGQSSDSIPTVSDTVGRLVQSCGSELLLVEPAVLPYGSTLTLGDTICASETTGITCRSLISGAGFEVSRASYRLF